MVDEPKQISAVPALPLRWPELIWLAFVLLTSSGLAYYTGRQIGPTFDEPFYLTRGLEYWQTGSPKLLMRAGTMPLPVDLQTLPLYVWQCQRDTPFNVIEDQDQLLLVARSMTLLFWWLLLISAFRLARWWGGPAASAMAVGLLGFEPNLLAHAALATTDIAVTAGILTATNAFVRGRDRGWWRRVAIQGVWVGFAVLCKVSAVTYLPLAFAVILWPKLQLKKAIRDCLGMAIIGAVVIFGYVGSDWATEPSFQKWAATLPDNTVGDIVRYLADHIRIFPNAGEGIVQQFKHNIRGHGVYTLGEYHSRAVWYYFPVLISQKVTEPLVILLAICALIRPGSLLTTAAGMTLLCLIFSLTFRVQIGIRLIFPILAFAVVAVSIAVSRWPRRYHVLGYGAVLATMLISFFTVPHGLRYQNQFWSMYTVPAETLTDSNYDWGQGIPELRVWWQDQGKPELHVWYYGTDPNAFRPPFLPLPLHVLPDRSVNFLRSTCKGGYLAVGHSFLTACPDRRPDMLELIDWLKSQKPVADFGCFRVYKFD